jgi:hypothetical protein
LIAATFGGASLFSPMLATSKSASLIGLSLLPRQVQDTFLGLFWLQAAVVVVVVLLITQALLLRQLQGGVAATVCTQKNLPVDPRIIELSRIPAQAANQPQFTHAQRPSKTTVVPAKPWSHFDCQLRLPIKIGSNFRWDDT